MNKNLINYSKFVLSCGILAGICFYSYQENPKGEEGLEELVSLSCEKEKDSTKVSKKSVDYEKRMNIYSGKQALRINSGIIFSQ